jgi:hypothetical protein
VPRLLPRHGDPAAQPPVHGPRRQEPRELSPLNRPGQRAVTDWERRLSAGFARRGLDAPGVRSLRWSRATAHAAPPGGRPRMCPLRRLPEKNVPNGAGFSSAFKERQRVHSRTMHPRCRDAEGGRKDKPGGMFFDGNRLSSPDAADAASSRDGAEPAGNPAIPVSRASARRRMHLLATPLQRCRASAGAPRPEPRRRKRPMTGALRSRR